MDAGDAMNVENGDPNPNPGNAPDNLPPPQLQPIDRLQNPEDQYFARSATLFVRGGRLGKVIYQVPRTSVCVDFNRPVNFGVERSMRVFSAEQRVRLARNQDIHSWAGGVNLKSFVALRVNGTRTRYPFRSHPTRSVRIEPNCIHWFYKVVGFGNELFPVPSFHVAEVVQALLNGPDRWRLFCTFQRYPPTHLRATDQELGGYVHFSPHIQGWESVKLRHPPPTFPHTWDAPCNPVLIVDRVPPRNIREPAAAVARGGQVAQVAEAPHVADAERERIPPVEREAVAPLDNAQNAQNAEAPSSENVQERPDQRGLMPQCSICLDATSSHAFTPCGHLCSCQGCSIDIIVRGRCPICRAAVQGAMQIFIQ